MLDNATDRQLIEAAFELFRSRLPGDWSAELAESAIDEETGPVIHVKGGSTSNTLIIEPRQSLTPRDITSSFAAPTFRRLRARGGHELLVIAPYLSSRARELLARERISYIDLTGNMRIVMNYPPMWVETDGASKNPAPDRRAARGMRGGAAGKVVRVLTDVRPPYGVTDLAAVARVDAGYVTRVLGALEAEGLVERGPRGRVADVDWESLLRKRAEVTDLLSRKSASFFVAPRDVVSMVGRLEMLPYTELMVSGSVAASRFRPISPPTLLVVYTQVDRATIARELGLLPVDEGANVALIAPKTTGPFFNAIPSPPLFFAAASQTALDCLSGNGRMPSEGEAVIDWMRKDESTWRASSLQDARWPAWVPR